jgi:hypothetical protein
VSDVSVIADHHPTYNIHPTTHNSGTTAVALLDIVRQAGATCVGFAFLIEKSFEGAVVFACS